MMTDLEITKLCAEAMGYKLGHEEANHDAVGCVWVDAGLGCGYHYHPMDNDAQAMELVKRYLITVQFTSYPTPGWIAYDSLSLGSGRGDNPAGAICECVAKMQIAKQRANTLLAGVQSQG